MIVYLITHIPSLRRYVGITTKTKEIRWANHISCAFRKSSKESRHLHNAIRKHGPEQFSIKEIAHAESLEELKILEIRLISELNTFSPNGFNLTLGGEGAVGAKRTPETLIKMSLAGKLRPKPSEATRTKIKNALTPEVRAKIGNALRGKKRSKEQREHLSIQHKNSPAVLAQIENLRILHTGRKQPKEEIEKRIKAMKTSQAVKDAWAARKGRPLTPAELAGHAAKRGQKAAPETLIKKSASLKIAWKTSPRAIRITFNGYTKTISEWADETNLSMTCIRKRIKRKWTPEQILTTPLEGFTR